MLDNEVSCEQHNDFMKLTLVRKIDDNLYQQAMMLNIMPFCKSPEDCRSLIATLQYALHNMQYNMSYKLKLGM